ncbi:MAG TPA: hypothetical protein VF528_08665 [Pyrinomonadaceae bacterium]|jgi:transcriptional regulator with XRE-family HTH domain
MMETPHEVEPEHIWTTNVLGDLVAAVKPGISQPQRRSVSKFLALYVDVVASGEIGQFAKYVDVEDSNLRSWLRSDTLPRLDVLLSMCRRLKTTPLGFFLGESVSEKRNFDGSTLTQYPRSRPTDISSASEERLFEQLKTALHGREDRAIYNILRRYKEPLPSWNKILKRTGYQPYLLKRNYPQSYQFLLSKREKSKKSYWQTIERILRQVVESREPILIESVAAQLKCNQRTLYRKFPNLCHAITECYADYIKARAREREERFSREIRQVIIRLKREGLYPSYRRILFRVSPPKFNHHVVYKIIREARLELDNVTVKALAA